MQHTPANSVLLSRTFNDVNQAEPPAVDAKRYKRDDIRAQTSDVPSALAGLILALQSSMELVATYDASDDEEDLFLKINEIVARLEQVSQATENPNEHDEAVLNVPIPQKLLEYLDRADGRSNPKVYTAEIVNAILIESQRVDQAQNRLSQLARDLNSVQAE